MPIFTVKVKWGKEIFPDVEVDTEDTPEFFKSQLSTLTGVKVERQKVMLQGSMLKDDWGNFKLRDGVTVLLMGSKEEDVPTEPIEKPCFVEDCKNPNLASSGLPGGLANLGNTCYLNATVQCLKCVPELKEALKSFSGSIAPTNSFEHNITAALRDLYDGMDKRTFCSPLFLMQLLHLKFPRFAETTQHGVYQQQDASECWMELMRILQQELPAKENPTSADDEEPSYKPRSFIEQYFGGTLETKLECLEEPNEPPTFGKEEFLQLSCFISKGVLYMIEGLKENGEERITKMSSTLGRDAQYKKTSKITRLPAYLTVQFVRFYYKEKEGINAKILKDVKFPFDFDAFPLCSEELQKKLLPVRNKMKQSKLKIVLTKAPPVDFQNVPLDEKVHSFPNDLGSNNTGKYTLRAILTHGGRSSNSGHYIAWVRQDHHMWLKFDDEKVSLVQAESILKLTGGGDWHCAYILLYGPKFV